MIILITGASKSGKSTVANALRNNAINYKRGALLVDENCDGETVPLLEKIAGEPLKQGVDASEQNWKPESSIIIVGDGAAARLASFEELVPGFAEFHGPVYTIKCGKA